ncbi:recombinase family protein [Roseomonas sp. GCM10028921]
MIVGYARTSTVEQEARLEGQERDLQATGCGKVFTERVYRPQFLRHRVGPYAARAAGES